MKSNNILHLLTAAALALGTAGAFAAQNKEASQGQLKDKDYKFVTEAAQGSMMEVQLGQLAQQKGASQAVRNFGQRMVTDHSKALEELKQITSQKGIALPAETKSEHSTIEHLQKASGKDFDKAYAEHMVKDHKKDIKEFQKAAKEATDPDVRAFAAKTLPILEAHMSMARDMEKLAK